MKHHSCTLVRGIEIDDKLVNTILLLWEAGVETRYCCEGISWDRGRRNTGYIAFRNIDAAMLFDKLMGVSSYQCYADWEWSPKSKLYCLRMRHFDAFVIEVAYEFSKR